MENKDIYLTLFSKNITEIEKIINTTSILCIKALCLVWVGKKKEALELINSIDQDNLSILEKQFLVETKLLLPDGKKDKEIVFKLALETVEKYHNSFLANYILSILYKKDRQWKQSYEYYKKCIGILPEFEQLNFELASLALKQRLLPDYYIYLSKIKNKKQRVLLYIESHIIVKIFTIILTILILWAIGNPFVIIFLFGVVSKGWYVSRSKGYIIQENLYKRISIGYILFYLGWIIINNIKLHL